MASHLGSLMLEAGQRYADRPALWVDGSEHSYSELLCCAQQVAAPLSEHRVARCAVFSTRSIWAYAGVLGALQAGSVYVPLNLHHPVERLVHVLEAADVGAIIIDQRSQDIGCQLLARHRRRLFVIWLADGAPKPIAPHSYITSLPQDVEIVTQCQDGAYLLFTSGSTGTPKGVLVSHTNVLSYLSVAKDRYALTADDRCTQLFDLTFDLSVHDMFVTWQAGACLYVPPASVCMAPGNFLKRHNLTCWFSVPSVAASMAQVHMLRPDAFPSLRLSLFCGESLPRSLAQAWIEAAPNSLVENLYGPTEATIAITAYRLFGQINDLPDIVPIGEVFPGHQVVIVDETGRVADDGELFVAGPQISLGYWRQPELTSERFAPPPDDLGGERWFRTGDRVRRSDHGLLFLGRLDRQVKIAGYRVELQEVETVLRRAAGNVNVAAMAWPFHGMARGIVAFVADHGEDNHHILLVCQRELPTYMIPRQIHRVTDWPLSLNGKTDYAQLRAVV